MTRTVEAQYFISKLFKIQQLIAIKKRLFRKDSNKINLLQTE